MAIPIQPTIITSFSNVQEKLNGIPPVANGFLRVYRGQNANFETIKATANRGKKIQHRQRWDNYCGLLAKKMINDKNTISNLNKGAEDLLLWTFFVRAISQHYGPGTEFLDLTHSLEVAIWFALHKAVRIRRTVTIGPAGGPSECDFRATNNWFKHEKFASPGWLFIFDFPVSKNMLQPKHGSIVDLAEMMPSHFPQSQRILAQKACLVATESNVEGGDLSSFLSCEPIRIGGPMSDLPRKEMRTSSLFPSPDLDEWYSRFIRIPQSLSEIEEDTLQLSIPLELYLEDERFEDEYSKKTASYLSYIDPIAIHPIRIEQNPEDRRDFEQALPILLENPILQTGYPIESGMWNEEILWTNIGCRPLNFSSGTMPSGTNLIYNVWVEFSPLEVLDWLEIDEGRHRSWSRCMWIRVYPEYAKVIMAIQSFPDSRSIRSLMKIVYFDSTQRSFMHTDNLSHGDPQLVKEFNLLGDPFYRVVDLLADLSPGIKPKPFPVAISDERQMLVVALDRSSILQPNIQIPGTKKKYLSPRYISNNEPYASAFGVLDPAYSGWIESRKSFNEIPMSDVCAAIWGEQKGR